MEHAWLETAIHSSLEDKDKTKHNKAHKRKEKLSKTTHIFNNEKKNVQVRVATYYIILYMVPFANEFYSSGTLDPYAFIQRLNMKVSTAL